MSMAAIEVRSASKADAAAIFELVNAVHLAEVGEPSTTLAEIIAELANPTERTGVVDDPCGGVRGVAFIDYEAGHEKCWGDVVVLPDGDVEVGRALVAWLLESARDMAPGVPSHVFCDSSNLLKQKVYAEAGGVVVRRFFRMAIDLAEDVQIDVPALGAGAAIRSVSFNDADLRTMHQVIDTAFLDHFGHEPEPYDVWRARSVEGQCPDPTLWWLATVDGEPAAGLYANVLPTFGYVDTLGTLRQYRGRGLGRALLLTAFAEFHRRGLRRAVLGVDATNPTGALGLYESVGMRPEHEGMRHELPPLPTG